MQQPLTARQLITILVILGVIAVVILGARARIHSVSQVNHQVTCLNQGLAPDCPK